MGKLPRETEKLSNLRVVLLEQNEFIGDTSAICDNGAELVHFAADCKNGISCSCCDVCCDEEDQICNAGEWYVDTFALRVLCMTTSILTRT